MKPRMRPFNGTSPNFPCGFLLVVVLLHDVSTQPIPNCRTPSNVQGQRPPFSHPERWSPSPQGPPMPCPYECTRVVKVPEKIKVPHPIFFPCTIPIAWPTPFTGSLSAPVPHPIHTDPPTLTTEHPSDTCAMYIPVPQYEFIPLYYNVPITSEPVEKNLPGKPLPELKPQVQTVQPPTTCAPSKSSQAQTPSPTNIPVRAPPSKAQPKPSDSGREDQPPKPQFLVPPPKHTWVPPPENLPEYIPPPPSFLHTRSSEPTSKNDPYDYVTFEPQYYTASDDHITYSPEIYSYYPDSYFRYDPYTNTPYYGRYNKAFYNRPPYVTYGPDIATYTEPTQYESGYVNYGPQIVTYTEEAPFPPSRKGPAPAKPPPPPYQPSPPDRSPYVTYGSDIVTIRQPTEDVSGSTTYGPDIVIYTEAAPVPPSPKRPAPAKPPRPVYQPPPSDRPPYGTNDSDIATIGEPAKDESSSRTYGPHIVTYTEEAPVPPSPKRPAPAKTPRPVYQPLPSDSPLYVTYDSDIATISEPAKDESGSRTYGPHTVTYTEEAPVPPSPKRPAPAKTPRPVYQVPPSDRPLYVTYDSDIATISEPANDESGSRTYGPHIVTYTEEAPVPRSPKRPAPAKSPRPVYQVPPSDRPVYLTYDSDIATINEPAKDENGSRTYGPHIVTYTEEAPVPPSLKRPAPAKQRRSSGQALKSLSPQRPVSISGRSSAFSEPSTPEDEESGYYFFSPGYYTVVDDDDGTEKVIYESNTNEDSHTVPANEDLDVLNY